MSSHTSSAVVRTSAFCRLRSERNDLAHDERLEDKPLPQFCPSNMVILLWDATLHSIE